MRNIVWYHSQLWRLANKGKKEMVGEMRRKPTTKQNCFHHSTLKFPISHCLIISQFESRLLACMWSQRCFVGSTYRLESPPGYSNTICYLFFQCLVKFLRKTQTSFYDQCDAFRCISTQQFRRCLQKGLNEMQSRCLIIGCIGWYSIE